MTLKRAIAGCYGVGEERILGGPKWAASDRFQITAKADLPVGDEILDAMLRTLLAERFLLKVHRETRSGDALILEVAKSGPRLVAAVSGPAAYNNGHGHLEAPNLTMPQFAEILSRDLKLPVLDRTALPGAFNFTLHWNADRPRMAHPAEAAADLHSEISAAMTKQLGLALKSQRMPVDVLVIDHVEKPSDN